MCLEFETMESDPISKLLDTQMATAEESKRLNRSKPVPRPHRDSCMTQMLWQMRALKAEMDKEENKSMLETSITILSSKLMIK